MTRIEVESADGTIITGETQGRGPVVVLIDGAFGFRGSSPLDEVADAVAEHATAVRYDRRGRGRSTDTAPYAPEREAEDLCAVLDALDRPATLVGLSSGCALAVMAASAGRADLLVLFEPSFPAGEPDPAQHVLATRLAGLAASGDRDGAVEGFQRGIGLPDEAIAHAKSLPLWSTLTEIAPTAAYDVELSAAARELELGGIETPATVLASTGSWPALRSWAASVADALPHARLRTLDGGPHSLPPTVFAYAVLEAMRGAGTT